MKSPVGHEGLGLDDGPEAHLEQGLYAWDETKQAHTGGERVAGLVGAAEDSEPGHLWVWTGTVWQCCECLKQVRRKATANKACHGLPPSLNIAVQTAAANGHKLSVARDSKGTWCIWCVHCGSWGKHKAIGLAKRCKGATKAGETALKRVEKRIHPDGAWAGMLEQPVLLGRAARGRAVAGSEASS